MNELNPKQIPADAAISIKVITPEATHRIARFAYEYAWANRRRKVTIVHKANSMKFTDGLFLRICQEVAAEYPDIETDDRIIDNMCMRLMQKPEQYDVLVMENLFGDIVSDLVAGMVGGLRVASAGNIGTDSAVFEPIHGSAPTHAGKNEANPVAMILSGALMLRHLGEVGNVSPSAPTPLRIPGEGSWHGHNLWPKSLVKRYSVSLQGRSQPGSSKRLKRNGPRSATDGLPTRIVSARAWPTAGPFLKPAPLNPQAAYRPSGPI